jgi:hypothetical protein
VIVGVASRDTVEQMEAFVTRNGVDALDHVADPDGKVWDINGVPAQPAWVFIDGETGQATTQFGEIGQDGLTAGIEKLTAS